MCCISIIVKLFKRVQIQSQVIKGEGMNLSPTFIMYAPPPLPSAQKEILKGFALKEKMVTNTMIFFFFFYIKYHMIF